MGDLNPCIFRPKSRASMKAAKLEKISIDVQLELISYQCSQLSIAYDSDKVTLLT